MIYEYAFMLLAGPDAVVPAGRPPHSSLPEEPREGRALRPRQARQEPLARLQGRTQPGLHRRGDGIVYSVYENVVIFSNVVR